MKVWIFNNYNMLPEQGGLNRHYYFGKYLKHMGHEPVVFVGSHPHNTDLQLIEGRESFRVYQEEPFPWVLVKTSNYEGSKLKRVWSMLEYYRNAKKAAAHFEKPDAIIGSSAHPLAAVLAIRLGKKYGCRAIVEVRDLWPLRIVAYGVAGARNPAVIALRWLEKWIYTRADQVIFTMEGAYDYIREQHWEKAIPQSKIYYVNNGVDLELYDRNREDFQIADADLNDSDTFKVVYAGSIRKANHVGLIVDAAKLVKNPKVRFLIWGAGDEVDALRVRIKEENIQNVVIKGRIEKKYVPYITSKADLTMMHPASPQVLRFGVSYNKMFEALAAGKPLLSPFPCQYNPATQSGAGLSTKGQTPEEIAELVDQFAEMDAAAYQEMCGNARKAAERYDFKNLTKQLIDTIENKDGERA